MTNKKLRNRIARTLRKVMSWDDSRNMAKIVVRVMDVKPDQPLDEVLRDLRMALVMERTDPPKGWSVVLDGDQYGVELEDLQYTLAKDIEVVSVLMGRVPGAQEGAKPGSWSGIRTV